MGDKKEKQRGPHMDWMDRVGSKDLMGMFADRFFGNDKGGKTRSAFKNGMYRVAPQLAIEMVQWWASFGVSITLHELRPDIWGPNDKGPI